MGTLRAWRQKERHEVRAASRLQEEADRGTAETRRALPPWALFLTVRTPQQPGEWLLWSSPAPTLPSHPRHLHHLAASRPLQKPEANATLVPTFARPPLPPPVSPSAGVLSPQPHAPAWTVPATVPTSLPAVSVAFFRSAQSATPQRQAYPGQMAGADGVSRAGAQKPGRYKQVEKETLSRDVSGFPELPSAATLERLGGGCGEHCSGSLRLGAGTGLVGTNLLTQSLLMSAPLF